MAKRWCKYSCPDAWLQKMAQELMPGERDGASTCAVNKIWHCQIQGGNWGILPNNRFTPNSGVGAPLSGKSWICHCVVKALMLTHKTWHKHSFLHVWVQEMVQVSSLRGKR